MTLPATIYARFSNAEQGRGHSLDRQLTLCEEMASRHGWLTEPTRILRDEGKSAFSGTNRKPGGALYDFEQEVDQGRYLNGHVLIVEHLDRISRQGYDEVLPFLNKLTQAGVTVATVDGDRIYAAFERVPLGPVIEAVVKSELAREESEKKAIRLAAAWQKKVETAQQNDGSHIAITSTVPAWLNVDPKTKRMTLNEDRVRVLREIFQLTIDGYGTPAIAQQLNARGEPVWKHRNVKSKNGWTVGYLTKIVLNRAVLGEYQPTKKPRGVSNGTPRGTPILNYYPQAIDPIMFAKAGAARASRSGTSGSWQLTHNNLLSGIAKCYRCGGRMFQQMTVRKGNLRPDKHRSGKKYPARQNISYVTCFNAWNKVMDEEAGKLKCEERQNIRYEPFERSMVEIVAGFAASQADHSNPKRVRELEIELADARRQKEGRQQHADNLARSFAESGSPMMERLALEAETGVVEWTKRIAALEKQLDAERASTGEIDALAGEQAWFKDMEQIRTDIFDDDDDVRKPARIRMKQFLARSGARVVFLPGKTAVMAIGNDGMRFFFDKDGKCDGAEPGVNVIYAGPDGQLDWHPDDEAAA